MDAAALLSYHQAITLHTASAEDLELIPGIGSKSARAMIEYRDRAGPIQRIEQLVEVRGIGPKTIKKLEHYLKP
jgi:competence protein ComEA